ncbi:BnaC04g56710D [Brassica napus]|uniref:Yippee domain-containing protein n=2 Tax=Brassica TaxID=3705 RepID=A0A3P6CZ76_BRAOL|nr:unnamed protein product [Brassica napus]CDY61708.1 BnaC04g56710D [Brassica napus]VDD15681.1 unnamed protein product [Brassica oleracea]
MATTTAAATSGIFGIRIQDPRPGTGRVQARFGFSFGKMKPAPPPKKSRQDSWEIQPTPFQPYTEVFGIQRFRECELIHGRWAMLGTLGAIAVEGLTGIAWQDAGKVELVEGSSYLGQPLPFSLTTLIWIEVLVMGYIEFQRNAELDPEKRIYPGGSFDPLGLGSDPEKLDTLKLAEIKHSRLAMVAFLIFGLQAAITGKGPISFLATLTISEPLYLWVIEMGRLFVVHLEGKIYSCKHCKTHLALYEDIISKSFHCKHGKAYLFNKVSNVTIGETEDRMMMTGKHTVADIFCVSCGSIVGWRYETAHEKSQKYKEGKSVLERFKISGPDGSNYWVSSHGRHIGGSDADDS